jgi:hypothetical protein
MRADRLEWTVSKAASRMLEQWFEAGCPPLSRFDTTPPPFVEEQWRTIASKKTKDAKSGDSAKGVESILDDEDSKEDVVFQDPHTHAPSSKPRDTPS